MRFAAALLLTLAVAGPAAAQKQKPSAARLAVEKLVNEAADPSQTAVGRIQFVSLREDETASVTFKLDDLAETYWIYARCESCGSTITAKDASGGEIDDDTDKDGDVSLLIPPKTASTIKVEIEATTCDQEPCLIGVGLFSQN